MLFETQMSNYAKHAYEESEYPRILEDIRTIPQNSEYWRQLPSPVPRIRFNFVSELSILNKVKRARIVVEDEESDDGGYTDSDGE